MGKNKKKNGLILNQESYDFFLKEILETIQKAQYESFKTLNRQMMSLYWEIGNRICEKQEKEEWGKSVVEKLSQDLQKKFPGIKGFSVQNLWRMRQFYSLYHSNQRISPLARGKNAILSGGAG